MAHAMLYNTGQRECNAVATDPMVITITDIRAEV